MPCVNNRGSLIYIWGHIFSCPISTVNLFNMNARWTLQGFWQYAFLLHSLATYPSQEKEMNGKKNNSMKKLSLDQNSFS